MPAGSRRAASTVAEPVWFWQRMVSPHMAGFAEVLAETGREVTFVAEQEMAPDRAAQGWRAPRIGGARLRLATSADAVRDLAGRAPIDSIHICEGFRGNGLVGTAQRALAARGLRQWVIMETVDDAAWRGSLKRLDYARLVRRGQSRIEGLLAIGDATPSWLIARGMPAEKVFPFAYFLPDATPVGGRDFDEDAPFRFLFVGRLVELKQVDLLLDALRQMAATPFEVSVVGTGPEENRLRSKAAETLPGKVHWFGQKPIGEVPASMAEADCLVLPSRYDGWGAVVSEALMAGTPAICSDRCGVAGVVRASGRGGVFPAGDVHALAERLRAAMAQGRQTPGRRGELAKWARCLGATAGAKYLEAILRHREGGMRPEPPWLARAPLTALELQ